MSRIVPERQTSNETGWNRWTGKLHSVSIENVDTLEWLYNRTRSYDINAKETFPQSWWMPEYCLSFLPLETSTIRFNRRTVSGFRKSWPWCCKIDNSPFPLLASSSSLSLSALQEPGHSPRTWITIRQMRVNRHYSSKLTKAGAEQATFINIYHSPDTTLL